VVESIEGQSDCEECDDHGFAVAALERHECPVPAPSWRLMSWGALGPLGPVRLSARAGRVSLSRGLREEDPGRIVGPLAGGRLVGVVLRC
jgi:hypothetical protein